MDIDLSAYSPPHRAELETLLAADDWQEAIASGVVDAVRRERLEPGRTRPFVDSTVLPLLARNRARAQDMVSSGVTDEDTLLDALADWSASGGPVDAPISFLGLNLTADCNLRPRCAYCNQPRVPSVVDLAGWKEVVRQATTPQDGLGPYIYITGGEPLTLGEAIWGEGGLVRYATARGAGVNVNTNATLITPRVALALVRAGTLRLHISLDTGDPDLHDALRGRPGLSAVLRGIYNVQLARELVGVAYPGMHTNCVLTRSSLAGFEALFSFILRIRRVTADPKDPLFNDLFPHVVPVGGASNDRLRPTAEEFRRFYGEIWPRVAAQWDEHQAALGVPAGDRRALFGYFSNPFLRVTHRGGLEAYVQASAEARYGRLALSRHCYVAPTQAAFTPDGTQYRCGAHAIRHVRPLGTVERGGLRDHIHSGLPGLEGLPDADICDGCALATLYINQEVEARLRREARALLGRPDGAPDELDAPLAEEIDEI